MCVIKQPSVTFFGCVYERDGTHPNHAKISTVYNMPPADTATGLQKFLSMVTYLSPFVSSFHPSLPLSMKYTRRAQDSHGMNHTVKPLTLWNTWSAHMTLCTSTSISPSQSRLMLHRKALVSFYFKKATQWPLPLKSLKPNRAVLCQQRSWNVWLCSWCWIFPHIFSHAFAVESDHSPFCRSSWRTL